MITREVATKMIREGQRLIERGTEALLEQLPPANDDGAPPVASRGPIKVTDVDRARVRSVMRRKGFRGV
jgi:hypothetical protein